MTADKPLTISEQIDLLQERGMKISSEDAQFLYDNNYYRLSIYWRNHQQNPSQGNNKFAPETIFDEIKNIYRFERALRSTLIDGLMAFEMTLKARLAYELAHSNLGPFGYLQASSYRTDKITTKAGEELDLRDELIKELSKDIERSKDTFIAHYTNQNRPVPIWAGIEVASFGTISKMFTLLLDEELKTKTSKSFSQLDSKRFATNIYSLSIMRNICAHGGRIWNRSFHVTPSIKRSLRESGIQFRDNSALARIVVLVDLLRAVDPDSFEANQIELVIKDYQEYIEGLQYPFQK